MKVESKNYSNTDLPRLPLFSKRLSLCPRNWFQYSFSASPEITNNNTSSLSATLHNARLKQHKTQQLIRKIQIYDRHLLKKVHIETTENIRNQIEL